MSNFVDIFNGVIGVMGTILGAIGVALTVRSERKNKKLKTVDWQDISSATRMFKKKLSRQGFQPDVVISPGAKGGIIAQMFVDLYNQEIPIITGFIEAIEDSSEYDGYWDLKTSKWCVHYPSVIKDLAAKGTMKILIIDDFTMTGDSLKLLKENLEGIGFVPENIKACCVATTKVAVGAKKAPDCYYKIVDDEDFYFPWGKAK